MKSGKKGSKKRPRPEATSSEVDNVAERILAKTEAPATSSSSKEGRDARIDIGAFTAEDLLELGIEEFVSKRGNSYFRVKATPSRGPFFSVGACLAFMEGKYYKKVMKSATALLNAGKGADAEGNSSKSKKEKKDSNLVKMKARRKARKVNASEEVIASRKRKFQRKKQRREERKNGSSACQTLFEN